jgi:hypothetical protein
MIPMSLTEAHSFRVNVAQGEFCALIHTCGRMTFWKAQPRKRCDFLRPVYDRRQPLITGRATTCKPLLPGGVKCNSHSQLVRTT